MELDHIGAQEPVPILKIICIQADDWAWISSLFSVPLSQDPRKLPVAWGRLSFFPRTMNGYILVISSGGYTVTRLVSMSCWCFFEKQHTLTQKKKNIC